VLVAAAPAPAPAPDTTRARAPDPEVAAATARYQPNHPGIDRSRFSRLVDVATSALDGLTPVVLVNRRVDSALQTLEADPDAPFPTIHTATPPGLLGVARRTARHVTESLHDTHGTSPLEGRTVFGSTRFVGTADSRAGAHAVLDALGRQGDVGVGAYGPVSLLVHPTALEGRTTFAARDTAMGVTRVTDASNMPHVVAERIARGVPGAPTPAQLDEPTPLADAARTLRSWLTGDGLARRDGYIEAQVRGLSPRDLGGVHIAHTYDGPVMKKIKPGPLPDAPLTARIANAARRLGLAVAEGPHATA
jgi:hypothetical protein